MKFEGENKPESNILKQLELLRDRCQDHDKIALTIAIAALEHCRDIDIDRHAEICKAEADGRLVVLSCKIGDEVWFLEKQLDIANGTCSTVISEYIVTEIRGNKYNPLWYMASSERCTHIDFHPTELGKTVFLTKEEAEKALERSGQDGCGKKNKA